jgi:hypothetical protein
VLFALGMGCFQSKLFGSTLKTTIQSKSICSTVKPKKKKNQNIMIWLHEREIGKPANTKIFMEMYIEKILMLFPNKHRYENASTHQECIELFRKKVPTNSGGYKILLSHFNWLYFELDRQFLFMECHVNDFIGNMALVTICDCGKPYR